MSREFQFHHLDIWVQKFKNHSKFYFYRLITGLPLFKIGDNKDNLPFFQSTLLYSMRLGY